MNRIDRHRRIRVVHVSLQLDVGGMEKLLIEFARLADRTRYDLRFVSLTTKGAVADDIEIHGWPVVAMFKPPGRCPGLILRLASLFKGSNPCIVHTHNTASLLYGGPAARIANVSAVLNTRHGQPYLASRRRIAAFRFASLVADRIVCVSDDCLMLTAANGVAVRKLCTIRNGIDLTRFRYSGPKLGGPAVSVARLSPEKDISTLIHAVSIVIRSIPSFRLEIAGDGPCMQDLRRLSIELGLDQHVCFLGEVRDVPSLLARASLFVLPSLTEGISLTLLEAMAAGLPVVATAVGGNREVVSDGETGLLVPPASPAALAFAICQMASGEADGSAMGHLGRDRIAKHFDVCNMVRDYEQLYCQILQGDHRKEICQQ